MKNSIVIFLSTAFLISCAGEEPSDDQTTEQDSSAVEIVEEVLEIDITLNKITEVPSECEFEYNMVDAYSWVDANGTNYFIRTISEIDMTYPENDGDELNSQYLFAYHYVKSSKGEFRLLKETTDL